MNAADGLLKRTSRMPPKHLSGLRRLFNQDWFVIGSGLPAFDDLLVEDEHRTYIRHFLKLFVAQGLICRHNICFISPFDRVEIFLKDVPSIYNDVTEPPKPTDQLVIAWRYQNLHISEENNSLPKKNHLSNDFDMSKKLDLTAFAPISPLVSCELRINPLLSLEENLLRVLEHIEKIARMNDKSVHRIVIDSIASPLWGRQPANLPTCIARFMSRLRLLLRHSFHVVYITVPKSALQESGFEARWISYADYTFELTGFDGLDASGKVIANPLYEEYSGLLKVHKLPSISGMNLGPIARPLTSEWAFKVKRNKFVLRHLNLPPCLSDNVSRSNVAVSQSHPIPCAGSLNESGLNF